MSQFTLALIASASILIIILATDLGHRRVTTFRMLRSLIAVAVVIAVFVHSIPTTGNDLAFQLTGLGAGVICGLVAGSMLRVYQAADGGTQTFGGIGYATIWVVLSAARVIFAYGTENWFPQEIVQFSIDYKLSGADVYANAFVFMALAMVLTRTTVLLAKRRRLARSISVGRRSGAEPGRELNNF